MPKIRSKMIAAAVITMMSLAMLVVASVAWFTISTNPEISGMEVSIAAAERLLVSKTGEEDTWEETLDLSEYFKYYAPLKPVSTVDGLNWFLPMYNGDGSLADVNDFELDDELKYANSMIYKESGGKMVKMTGNELQNQSNNGYYVYGDFYLKTEEEEADVYISFPNAYAQTNTKLNSTDGTYVLPAYEIIKTELPASDTIDADDSDSIGDGSGGDTPQAEYTVNNISQDAQNTVRVGLLLNPDYTDYPKSVAPVSGTEDYDYNTFFIYEPNADKRTGINKPITSEDDDTDRYIISYDYKADVNADTGAVTALDYKDGYYYETLPIKKTNEPYKVKGDVVEQYKYTQTRINPSNLIVQNASEWDEDSLKQSMIDAYGTDEKWWSSFDVKYPYGSFLNSNSLYNGTKYDVTFYPGLMTNNPGTENEGTGSGIQVLFPYQETIQVAEKNEDGTEKKNEDGSTVFTEETVTKYFSPYAAAEVSASSQNIITLEKDKPVRVRLFIWIEGQDIDCWNDVAAGGFVVNLELGAKTREEEKPAKPNVTVKSAGQPLEENQLVSDTVYFEITSDGEVPIGYYEYSTDYSTLSDKTEAHWSRYNSVSTRFRNTGSYSVSFRSVSANGVVNDDEESITTVTFRILMSDKPVITVNVPDVSDVKGQKIEYPVNGWYPDGTTLSASVSDSTGKITLQYKAPGSAVWADYTAGTVITGLDGENTYSFRTVAKAEEFEYPAQSETLKIEKEPPEFAVTAVTNTGSGGAEIEYKSGDEGGQYVIFTFTLDETTKRSGLSYKYYYSFNGETPKELTESPGAVFTKSFTESGDYVFILQSSAGGLMQSRWTVKLNTASAVS